MELRSEYCDFIMDLLTSPEANQKKYLANLSQGFFAYNMLGINPSEQEVRRKLTEETVWLLDSNVLMPLVATYCHASTFVQQLLDIILSLGIKPLTTRAFVAEVKTSVDWVRWQFKRLPEVNWNEALLDLISSAEYRENLFIDGVINGCSLRLAEDPLQYLDSLKMNTLEDCVQRFEGIEIGVIDFKTLRGIDGSDELAVATATREIREERERGKTLRAGDIQAEAEAEALQILRLYRQGRATLDSKPRRAYFLSTSRLLDKMYRATDGLLTWFPENLYRHLQYLSTSPIDPDAMYEAIASSFYSIGITILDEASYRSCFTRPITEASAVFEREKRSYIQALDLSIESAQDEQQRLEALYRSTPDLDKVRFVSFMG